MIPDEITHDIRTLYGSLTSDQLERAIQLIEQHGIAPGVYVGRNCGCLYGTYMVALTDAPGYDLAAVMSVAQAARITTGDDASDFAIAIESRLGLENSHLESWLILQSIYTPIPLDGSEIVLPPESELVQSVLGVLKSLLNGVK